MRIVISVILLLFFAIPGNAQDNSWDKRANFGGLKRERAVAFSVGNYGYVGTGIDTAEILHKDLWRFDPATNVWAQMADLPGVARRNAVAFTIGEKGYVGTGMDAEMASLGNNLSDFWEYNPTSNSWTGIASYPGAGGAGVYYGTAFSIGSKGFVCAGKIGADLYVYDLWEYDPVLDNWTERTSFPGGDRYALSSFTVEGKAYVGMGTDHDVYRKDWWQYDPATFTWTAKADLPGAERSAASTFTLSQRGFVIFGTDGGYSDELWEYNPFSDSWNIKAPFPAAGRKGGIAFTIGDTAYAGTGTNSSGKKQSFYAYIPGIVGIDEKNSAEVSVYPNPIESDFMVKVDDKLLNGTFQLFHINGQLIWESTIEKSECKLTKPEGIQGYYLLKINNTDYSIFTTKTLYFK